MERITLAIEGMTCGHCVRAVRDALEGLPAVEVEAVEVGSATVRRDPERVTDAMLADALADEGYTTYRAA
jgi:copper chaperone